LQDDAKLSKYSGPNPFNRFYPNTFHPWHHLSLNSTHAKYLLQLRLIERVEEIKRDILQMQARMNEVAMADGGALK
jgi:hypothetical protein